MLMQGKNCQKCQKMILLNSNYYKEKVHCLYVYQILSGPPLLHIKRKVLKNK